MYTKWGGLMLIEQLRKLRENQDFLAATGVHKDRLGKDFRIRISNLYKHPVKIIQDRWVATAKEHYETLIEADLSHSEMIGIVESKNMYRKRDQKAKDIKFISNHLEEARKAALVE